MSSMRQMAGAFMTLAAILLSPELQAVEANAQSVLRLSLPLDYQVHQRVTRAEGKIVVAGAWTKRGEHPGTLEARLVGAGAAADWRKLATIESGTTKFRAELNAARRMVSAGSAREI